MFERYKFQKYFNDIYALVYQIKGSRKGRSDFYDIQTYLVLRKGEKYKFIKYLKYEEIWDNEDRGYVGDLKKMRYKLEKKGYKEIERFLSEEQYQKQYDQILNDEEQKSDVKIKKLKK